MVLELSLGSFFGIDSLIDFMTLLVSSLISYQSWKVYKILNQKRYKFFSWSFGFLAISFLFKIFYNLTILHEVHITGPSFVSTLLKSLEVFETVNFASFFLYKLFMLAGFLILFLIVKKKTDKSDILLLSYLGLIVVFFSIYFNFTFHITTIIILSYFLYHLYQNNKKIKSKNSKLVFSAFSFILASQVVYLFYGLNAWIYLLAEVILFVGFSLLLINHARIKNGKKKNKA